MNQISTQVNSKSMEVRGDESHPRKLFPAAIGSRRGPRHTFILVAIVLLFGLCTTSLSAQSTTADILGTVTDPTGAFVPGATVKSTNRSTGEVRTLTTDDHGSYVFNGLLAGHYKIEVAVPGFKTFQVPDLLAAAGDRARVDAALTTGEVSETVQVEATTPLLQTDSSTLATTVVGKSVQDLPLNGRNFVQLAQLTVGANEGPPNGLTSGARPDDRRASASISVNGQSDVINNEMIDGADNNERIIGTIGIRPSIDAISEFRVQTNAYTAEVGRTAGGVINIITKSGSNLLHGTLYEYFRNDKLDASNYVFGGANLPKSELRQNQFGGSIGGPILRNKLFFFGDYEGYRNIQGQTQSATVPTLFEEENLGNFTDVVQGLNVSSRVSPIARNWFKLFPAPNTGVPTTTSNNYQGTQNKTQKSDLFDVRIDDTITPKDMVYGRFSYNLVKTFTPGILPAITVAGIKVSPGGNIVGYAGPANDAADNFQLNYTHLFSPSLLMNLVASYLRIDNVSLPLNYGTNASAAFGYTGVNLGATTSALTPVAVTGYASVGDSPALPVNDVDNTFQYGGTLTWTHGIHNVKVGASLIRRQALNSQNILGVGYLINAFQNTAQANMANFLEGNIDIADRNNSLSDPHYRMWESGFFVQDDVHLLQHLTVNLGLRYEIFTPFIEIQNRISNFDPDTASIVVASDKDRTAGVQTQHTNVAPRIGFSDELGHGTVLRGGFGLSFFPSNYTANASLKNQPFVSTYNGLFTTLAAGLPEPVAASATNPSGSIPDNISPDFRISYLEQFNLMVQKQLGSNVLTVGYVVMLGRHLGEVLPDINASLPSGSATPNPRPFAQALPNVAAIGMVETEGASSYHALQMALQRRFTKGLSVDVNYTYAHGLDNAPGLSNEFGDGYGASPTTRGTYEYGNSDLDLHHRIAGNVIYELPFGKSSTGAKGLLAKGWQVNALAVWETGLPFTITNTTDIAGTLPGDNQVDRPNVVGNVRLGHPTQGEWFNTAAFQVQPVGTLGNERRNQIYGPPYGHLDMSLFKDFPFLHDRGIVQFRVESFNLSNTPTFANPMAASLELGSGSGFGTLSATNGNYTPRVLQFVLKVQF